MDADRDADAVIAALGLEPHPEGGRFREIHRDRPADGGRGALTAIYYLLRAGEVSRWHRVDAVEIWHFHAGGPLELRISPDGERVETHLLGLDPAAGQRPQVVVPKDAWQSARPLGPGPSPAAPSPRPSTSPASQWRRRAGSRAGTDRGWASALRASPLQAIRPTSRAMIDAQDGDVILPDLIGQDIGRSGNDQFARPRNPARTADMGVTGKAGRSLENPVQCPRRGLRGSRRRDRPAARSYRPERADTR